MKTYIIMFLKRGLLAASGGPVILAIVYAILGAVGVIDSLTPYEVCLGILTVSLMAFIAAGVGVVYSIERLPLFAAALIHGTALYLDYILIYLLNGWLVSQWMAVAIFTGIFIAGYAIVWLIVYLTAKAAAERLNCRLEKQ